MRDAVATFTVTYAGKRSLIVEQFAVLRRLLPSASVVQPRYGCHVVAALHTHTHKSVECRRTERQNDAFFKQGRAQTLLLPLDEERDINESSRSSSVAMSLLPTRSFRPCALASRSTASQSTSSSSDESLQARDY